MVIISLELRVMASLRWCIHLCMTPGLDIWNPMPCYMECFQFCSRAISMLPNTCNVMFMEAYDTAKVPRCDVSPQEHTCNHTMPVVITQQCKLVTSHWLRLEIQKPPDLASGWGSCLQCLWYLCRIPRVLIVATYSTCKRNSLHPMHWLEETHWDSLSLTP